MPSQIITKKVVDAAVSLLEVIPQLAKEYGYKQLGIPLETDTAGTSAKPSDSQRPEPAKAIPPVATPQQPQKTESKEPPKQAAKPNF